MYTGCDPLYILAKVVGYDLIYFPCQIYWLRSNIFALPAKMVGYAKDIAYAQIYFPPWQS
jgi:hypothetical protein